MRQFMIRKSTQINHLCSLATTLLITQRKKCWTFWVPCKTRGIANTWASHQSLESQKRKYLLKLKKSEEETIRMERENVVDKRKGDSDQGSGRSHTYLYNELLPIAKGAL